VKEVCRKLSLDQEDLDRGLDINFATANRWEKNQQKPSRLAKEQFDSFCTKMIRQRKLKLPGMPVRGRMQTGGDK
jgi:putative transcriptional regulator